MRNVSRSALICIILATLAIPGLRAEVALSVYPRMVGGWSFAIGEGNVPGGPGSDLKGEYESPADAEGLKVSGTMGSSDTWRIDMKRADSAWDADLVLSVRVRNAGTGNGTVEVSDAYRVVTDTLQPFLSGRGDREGLEIQLKMSGVSVARVRAGTYAADLVYLITDTE